MILAPTPTFRDSRPVTLQVSPMAHPGKHGMHSAAPGHSGLTSKRQPTRRQRMWTRQALPMSIRLDDPSSLWQTMDQTLRMPDNICCMLRESNSTSKAISDRSVMRLCRRVIPWDGSSCVTRMTCWELAFIRSAWKPVRDGFSVTSQGIRFDPGTVVDLLTAPNTINCAGRFGPLSPVRIAINLAAKFSRTASSMVISIRVRRC